MKDLTAYLFSRWGTLPTWILFRTYATKTFMRFQQSLRSLDLSTNFISDVLNSSLRLAHTPHEITLCKSACVIENTSLRKPLDFKCRKCIRHHLLLYTWAFVSLVWNISPSISFSMDPDARAPYCLDLVLTFPRKLSSRSLVRNHHINSSVCRCSTTMKAQAKIFLSFFWRLN